MSEQILIIGIDGVRYDTLLAEDTPHLDSLASRGFQKAVWVNDDGPTISGPVWATIVTGVLPSQHGITHNYLAENRLADFPDVFTMTRQQRPEVSTWLGAAWQPLVTTEWGGPLFAGGGYCPPGEQAHQPAEWAAADQAVTDVCAAWLSELEQDRPALGFCYLGGVDEVGHLLGVGQEYRDFVREADRLVGELLAVLDSRADGDQWSIIVVTDHGHVDAGGHGGDSVEERTAWMIAAGPTITPQPPQSLEQADVAGHVVHQLHLTPVQGFFGQPLGQR